MNDREVFKRVDGRWVSLGIFPASRAYQLRYQLMREGVRVKTEERAYYTGLRSVFK